MMDKNENKAMIEAVALLAKEKNIGKEVLFSAIEEALRSAYKNNFNKQYGIAPSNANVRVELDRVTGAVRLFARKTVVEWVIDEAGEISLSVKLISSSPALIFTWSPNRPSSSPSKRRHLLMARYRCTSTRSPTCAS